MTEPYSETDNVEVLVKRVQEALPDWSIDTVFDFGSHAKDEAVSESDLDLWFLVHSDNRILLDKTWKRGRYESTLTEFLSDYESMEIVEVDTWGEIAQRVKPKRPLEMSCPIADTRWYLWQLARKADWQTFLYTVFARPLFDPNHFLRELKQFLWDNLPFHIHPDHGIVFTLKRLCEAEKSSLMRELSLIERGRIERPKGCRPVWSRSAVECIRHSMVLLTLLREGQPVFTRQEVLKIIEVEFPEYLSSAQKAYWYKCTDEGRRAFIDLLEKPVLAELKSLKDLTREIIELWHQIMLRIDQVIVMGNAKLDFSDENWKDENTNLYNAFFSNYLMG